MRRFGIATENAEGECIKMLFTALSVAVVGRNGAAQRQ
jgi:hypothetical protein